MMFVNSLDGISTDEKYFIIIFEVKLVNRLDLRLSIRSILDQKMKKGITDKIIINYLVDILLSYQ